LASEICFRSQRPKSSSWGFVKFFFLGFVIQYFKLGQKSTNSRQAPLQSCRLVAVDLPSTSILSSRNDSVQSSYPQKSGALMKTFLFLLVAALIFFLNFDLGFVRGEITNYPIECETQVVDNKCPRAMAVLSTTTYKVSFTSQTVVYWTEGFAPGKLENCAVRNRRHWSCRFSNDAAVGFNKGQYFEQAAPGQARFSEVNAIHVWRFRYLLKKLLPRIRWY